ncbi:MAG: hypothetical protein ACPG19_07070 [Saprospiraceae bacterium]
MNKLGIFLLLIVGLSFSGCLEYTTEAQDSFKEKLIGNEWKLIKFVNTTQDVTISSDIRILFDELTYTRQVNMTAPSTFEYEVEPGVLYLDGIRNEVFELNSKEMVLFDERDNTTLFYEKTN